MIKTSRVDFHNPEFQTYKIQRDDLVEKEKLFLADGLKVVERLILSTYPIREIICLEKYLPKLELLAPNRKDFPPVFIGTEEELRTIRGYDLHQGIMAVSQVPDLDATEINAPLVILNNVLEANNIGSIIRSAVALGVNNCLIDESTCHPYIRRSVRVSMGTILKIYIKRTYNLSQEIQKLQEKGVTIFGTSIRPIGDKPLLNFYKTTFPAKSAIILGNEAKGVSEEILNLCDHHIYIPMENGVDSLNVSVSGAILISGLKRSI
ncbi:MAG: RNA methyltransferase [Leptospiraceae bacterium]|nr:RNA methyltransferase [Leptospiraceae bacterium]